MRTFTAWPGVSKYAGRKLHRDSAFVGMLVAFCILMIWCVPRPLIIDVFFKVYPFESILADGHLDKDHPPLDLGMLGTPNLGAATLVKLEFNASDTSGDPNLLQTDFGDRGLRLELSRSALLLIVGGPTDSDPHRVYVLSEKVHIGSWHSVQLKMLSGYYVEVILDGASAAIPNVEIPFSLANTRIGIGVDGTRRFQGEMRNINVSSSNAVVFQYFLSVANDVAPWLDAVVPWLIALSLIVLAQRWIAYYPPTKYTAFIGMLVVFALLMICYVAQPLIIEVFFKVSPFKTILADGHLDRDNSPLDFGILGTPSLEAATLVNLEFNASDTSGDPNLLQTDFANRGVRLELNGSLLALVVGGPTNEDAHRVYILSQTINVGSWHSVQLKLLSGQYIGIVLDGVSVSIPTATLFSSEHLRIGIGVDNTRRFKGEMRNINVSYSDAIIFLRLLSIADAVAPWLIALSLIILARRWIAYYSPTKYTAFVGILVVFVLLMICFVPKPLIIDVFFKIYPFESILADGHLDRDHSPLDLGMLGTPSLGAATLMKLEFNASDTSGDPNLLQTDFGNRGLRLELSRSALLLVVGGPTDSDPHRAYVLSKKVPIGNWHSVQLKMLSGYYVEVILDGASAAIPNVEIPFSFANTRIGTGVDGTRRFQGEMRNINVSSSNAVVFQYFLWIADNVAPWLLALSLMILMQRYMAHYKLTLGDLVGLLKSAVQSLTLSVRNEIQSLALSMKNQAIILSAVLILSGILYAVLVQYSIQYGASIVQTLLPGFSVTIGARPFKIEVLSFILLEVGLAGTLALTSISSCLHIFEKPLAFRNYIFIALGAGAASIAVSNNVARIVIVSGCAPLLVHALLSARAKYLISPPVLATAITTARPIFSDIGLAQSVADSATNRLFRVLMPRNPKAANLMLRGILPAAGILICGLLAWPYFQAWVPIAIPNDYMEIQDVFQFDGSPPIDVERAELARCLAATEKLDPNHSPPTEHALSAQCDRESLLPDQDRSRAQAAIKATAAWQSEAGRTLFHHSYVFLPAGHFLTFGLDRAVPYLYGFGNTLFHAMLMSLAGGASLSTYFSTFPIAGMFGIVAIALLVLLITRNAWAAFIGFALSLSAFYMITYIAVFLAASFSPLRFFGIVLQLAAMCLCCRAGRQSHFVLLPLAAIASLFWNVEFALLGLPGQILLLLSPQIRLSLQLRGLLVMTLIASAAIFMVVSRPSSDIVSTVQLSFFNVGMPYMTYSDAMWFFLSVGSAQAALFGLSFLFVGPERALRIAFLPCLALLLIKYVYNPSPPHLYVVLTLLWPICLTYLPWASSPGLFRWTLPRLVAPALAAVFTFVAAQGGRSFKEQSIEFRSAYIDNFKVGQWPRLDETIGFIAPEEEFYERILSIKSRIRPDDTLVLLSPYDHVLNFYVNPQKICGHFDLLTNLATREVADKVVECATRSAQTMIVYDRSVETRCPADPLQNIPRCALKFEMKGNLIDLRNRLLPFVELVGSDNNLEFYRPRTKVAH